MKISENSFRYPRKLITEKENGSTNEAVFEKNYHFSVHVAVDRTNNESMIKEYFPLIYWIEKHWAEQQL